MLRIHQTEYDALRQHGEETYPNECCGVLLGRVESSGNRVLALERTENIRADSAHDRYQIAPQELIRIQREARQRGLTIVGFYHSHPDRPAQASKTDLAEAHWLGCSYVITRVCQQNAQARACETHSFLLTGAGETTEDKRLEEEKIEIEQSAGTATAATNAASLPHLSPEEMTRYSRHLLLPEVGLEGQKKLKSARVLCIGVGGLGAPLTLYLAAAGVGTLGLVDFDVVEASNLHRQIIHDASDIGRSKLDSAEERLRDLNPNVKIVKFETRLNRQNALEIFRDFDIIADGTDNFPTRYLVNDACVLSGKPNVYASIDRFAGQASVFATKAGPCYRCLHPEPPPLDMLPSCAEGGVLGVLPGLLGILQATEVLKLILGVGEPLIGRVLQADALALRFREFKLKKNPDCPVCGLHPSITRLMNEEKFCDIPATLAKNAPVGKNTYMVNGIPQIAPAELKRRLDAGEEILVLDVREPHEFAVAHIGGHLIPLNELPQRIGELDRTREIVVHCKVGGRSQKAAEFLAQAGFKKLHNLSGGITAWSETVDPSVPKY